MMDVGNAYSRMPTPLYTFSSDLFSSKILCTCVPPCFIYFESCRCKTRRRFLSKLIGDPSNAAKCSKGRRRRGRASHHGRRTNESISIQTILFSKTKHKAPCYSWRIYSFAGNRSEFRRRVNNRNIFPLIQF